MDSVDKTKTSISSILFADIVGFSIESVTDQLKLKSTLNQLVSTALGKVEQGDTIVLDTGDGSAICFLGDPEIALNVAVWIQATILELNPSMKHPLAVRFGINMGAVKILKDFNQHQNVVGDGINVAQRVMSFAEPNQILVSRSFYEVISCLTKENSARFEYKGVRKDKHEREHVVYEVKNAHVESTSDQTILPPVQEIRIPEEYFSAETLIALESVASSYLGPIGRVLIRSANKTRRDLSSLFETLAQQISNVNERNNFLKEMLCLLGSANGSCYLPLGTDSCNQVSGSVVHSQISLSDLEAITNKLGRYLGPIATTLVKYQIKSATDIDELCDVLAAEIDDIDDREMFIKDTKKFRKRESTSAAVH